MKNYLKSLRVKDYLFFVIICLFVVMQVIAEISLPEYSGKIIEHIQLSSKVSVIWSVGLKMIGFAFISVIASIIVSFFSSLVASSLAKNLRKKVFEKVNSFSMEEINKFSISSLITRTTNDITQIQQTVSLFLKMAIYAPAMSVYAMIKILDKSPTLSMVTLCALIGLVLIIVLMVIFVIPRYKKIQTKIDKVNSLTRESLTGIKTIRAFNAETTQEQKFENANASLTKDNLFVNRASSILFPGMYLILNFLTLAILWIGAYLIKDSQISLTDVTVFTQYAVQVFFGFLMLSFLLSMLPRAIVSGKRVSEILKTQNKIINGTNAGKGKVKTLAFNEDQNEKVSLEFKNVSFKYPDSEEYVLKDINFTAKSGETVAFIGSTGSGKSTIINLVPRFYDVTDGEVLINEVNVKNYTLKELNNKIGYVPQKSMLFSGNIKSNILYGNPTASEDQIMEALNIAQATDFVTNLKEGINHNISQGGKNVSGGQKQRLQIARAIVKKPQIYIFDDSFSALDYKTDKVLREKLKGSVKNAITLIVAQRVGTILDADKIVVLDSGKIVGMDTHKNLLNSCEVYKQIVFSQLSRKELED